ncbi:MAG: translation initiation factor IF-2 N-terminal domain-containing protein, partial [Clostridia bacterium]|nr:translation initiation factor IF-2 N-terminal domain-containing protein [Clostridia bacterium]
MAKIKAYELSKSFGIPSKDLVQILHDYNVSDKSHMSILDDNELNVIYEYVTQKNQVEDISIIFPKKEEKAPKPKIEKKAKKREDGTVIELESEGLSEEIPARKVRVVDTRANAVDLDHLDTEKLEELIP